MTQSKTGRKALALFLAMMMLFSLLPASAMAEDPVTEEEIIEEGNEDSFIEDEIFEEEIIEEEPVYEEELFFEEEQPAEETEEVDEEAGLSLSDSETFDSDPDPVNPGNPGIPVNPVTPVVPVTPATPVVQWKEPVSYTSDQTFERVDVDGNTTLTISNGVTVTITSKLQMNDDFTLTVMGGGTLSVTGIELGYFGSAAITGSGSQNSIIVDNATVNVTGGTGTRIGGSGIDHCNVTVNNGTVTITGGTGTEGNGQAINGGTISIAEGSTGTITADNESQSGKSYSGNARSVQVTAAPTPAPVTEEVTYLDANGTEHTVDAIVIDENTTELTGNTESSSYYVAQATGAEIKIPDRVNVTGYVTVILADNANLNAQMGIKIAEGGVLSVFGCAAGTGAMKAGDLAHQAFAGSGLAGIGGDGNFSVSGGMVSAYGSDGINCDMVGVTTGMLIAAGSDTGSGIKGNEISFSVATVKATGGSNGGKAVSGTVNLVASEIVWASSESMNDTLPLKDHTKNYVDSDSFKASHDQASVYIEPSPSASHEVVLTNRTIYVDGDATVNNRIVVKGNVTIQLEDGKTLTAAKGIYIDANSELTVEGAGTGKLIATGDTGYAGIQGGDGSRLIINSGNVEATGGENGNGINSILTVNGGDVIAVGASGTPGIGNTVTLGEGMIAYAGEDKDNAEYIANFAENHGQKYAHVYKGTAPITGPYFTDNHQVNLSEQIELRFMLVLPENFDTNDSYVDFSVTSGRTHHVAFNDETYMLRVEGETNAYWFICPLNVLELNDTVSATYTYTGGTAKATGWTVMLYFEQFKQLYPTHALCKLIDALQNYGHYMQLSSWKDGTATEQRTHNNIAAASGSEISSIEDVRSAVASKAVSVDLGTSGINDAMFSLTLNQKTIINAYFNTNGVTIQETPNGRRSISGTTYYRFDSAPIKPTQLGNTIKLTATTDSGTATVTASALSYVYAIVREGSGASVANQNAMASFYDYYNVAKDFA